VAEGKLSLHDLDLIVRQTDDLPAMPGAVARVVELTDPQVVAESGAADVLNRAARACGADAALAARVIRLAGGAHRRAAPSVPAAVRLLGIDALRAAVLSNKVFVRNGTEPAGGPLDRRELWLHNLTVALASRLLAERLASPGEGDEAYLAGLMHDVGILLLSESLPKSYARAAGGLSTGMSLAECEKRSIGVDHLAAGRRLAQHWGLGPAAQSAAWLHHMPGGAIPDSAPKAQLARVVALANVLAKRRASACGGASAGATCEAMMRQLRLTDADLAEVDEQLDEQLELHADLLALADEPVRPVRVDWLSRANVELGRLGTRLGLGQRLLAARAGAFAELTDFAADLGAEANLPEVLLRIAGRFAASDEPAGCVAAYSLDDRAGAMLAVRAEARASGDAPGGAQPAQWRTFALAAGWHTLAAPHAADAPHDVLRGLLGSVEGWAGWMDLDNTRHVPLICGGRWLGGVIAPAGLDDAARHDAVAPSLALVLGLVQQRSCAEAVSEELAGASRLLADARQELAEASVFAAVGDLAAGAGHELNTPLAVVSGRAQLMRDKARDPEQRRTWQTIAEQAQRISDIITDLMDFARPAVPEPQVLDARSVLDEAARAFSSSHHPQAESCKVDIEVDGDVPRLSADAGQLQAVLAALLENAAGAVGDGGRIAMSAASDAGRRCVLLRVQDDGPGMNGDTLRRVWTPFYSAQKAGRRRGLGLAKAKRYTENNGGKIWIDSEPGRGTIVSVQLPAAAANAREDEAEHGDPQDGASTGGG